MAASSSSSSSSQSFVRFACVYGGYLLLILCLLFLFQHQKQTMDLFNTKTRLQPTKHHNYRNESFANKLTVLILNYNRPKNFLTSLPLLSQMPIVHEIIVSHGNNATFQEFSYPKVRNLMDIELNHKFGPAVRFMRHKEISNDIVLYLDDDILPEEHIIYQSYAMLLDQYERNTLFGVATRSCDSKGYSFRGQSAVLTPFLMMKTSVVKDYVEYGLPIFRQWMQKYRGNCEDLSINLFVNNFYHEQVVVLSPPQRLRVLDRTHGISSDRTNHLHIRNTFCKTFYNQTFSTNKF